MLREQLNSFVFSILISALHSHVRRLTAQYGAPMPTIDIAHQRLITARAIHTAQKEEGTETVDILDWTSLIAGSRVAAGLDPFHSRKVSNIFFMCSSVSMNTWFVVAQGCC